MPHTGKPDLRRQSHANIFHHQELLAQENLPPVATSVSEHKAFTEYEEAIRIRPDYARAHFQLAAALEKLGRLPKAVERH
jgi:hypothetical protein